MSDTFDVDKFLKMAECLPFATAQAGKPETQKAMREAAAEITRLGEELAACKADRDTWKRSCEGAHYRMILARRALAFGDSTPLKPIADDIARAATAAPETTLPPVDG